MSMLRTGFRAVSKLLGCLSNSTRFNQLPQSSILNQCQVVAQPTRSILTLSKGPVVCTQHFSNFLQNSSVLKESRRNQGSSRVSHYAPMTRNLLKYGPKSGKPRTERVVLLKFYRLNWGAWIRTKCGRNKKIWKKSTNRKIRSKRHVFCNAKQSSLLDQMTCEYWKKPKYYVDDPYEPYHTREEFPLTRRKPVEWP